MDTPDRPIRTKEDADEIREDIEAVYDGWYAGEARIDWDDFLYRLEGWGYTLADGPECMVKDPAIKRIKAIVRELRKAG